MRLVIGDIIVVDNGARLPVDGIVKQGSSALNNALVTGESVPVPVGPGDVVAGGALLVGAPIRVEVLRGNRARTFGRG